MVFLAFTLELSIQTLIFVAPTSSIFWHATQIQQNEHTPELSISTVIVSSLCAEGLKRCRRRFQRHHVS